jgi:spore coat-associated protein N
MKSYSRLLSQGFGGAAIKVTIIVTAALGGVGLVSTNVFAALTATATNTSGGSVTTGTLKLEYAAAGASGGFATPVAAMSSGDTVNRYIDLNVSGTLDGESPTVQISTSDTNTLVSDGTKGLQISITACSVAWTQTGTGTCSGTASTVLASTSVLALKTAAANIVLPTKLATTTNRLKLSITLPVATENVVNGVLPVGTIQGLSAGLTWSFVIQERTSTTSSS